MHLLEPIAHIYTDFHHKFGIPRQSGLVKGLQARIVFEPEYRNVDALRGLEEYSHIWLIWHFSEAEQKGFSPTVRPPRLGGNQRVGVFATRSPFRPNALGLSSVRLDGMELHTEQGPVLYVRGADILDGTPIYDIKPYLPHIDCHPAAKGGFAARFEGYALQVECSPKLLEAVPSEKREALLGVLANDPRPSYHDDANRVYGMEFAGFEVKFTVEQKILTVHMIERP